MFAGVPGRQELTRVRPELFAARASIDRGLQIEQPRQNARDVGFDDWDWSIEGERRDCVCGVAANARQITNRIRRVRKATAILFPNNDRCGAEISGPRIITEALPGMKNLILRGSRECGDVGEAPQPFNIKRDDGRDLGLLKHELGNQDCVGIGGPPPWKIATVSLVPGTKSAPK